MASLDNTRTGYEIAVAANRTVAFVASIGHSIRAWNDARVTARALNALTDRELLDLGLTRSDISDVARSNIIR